MRSSLLRVLLHKVPLSVSITALIPFKNVLEIRKGVLPGTIAIRNFMEPKGSNNAWRQLSVCWLPNRKVRLQFVRVTCFRMWLGKPASSSGICWSPTTVCEAPRSTMPTVPDVANKTSLHELSGTLRDRLSAARTCCPLAHASLVKFSDDFMVLRRWRHSALNRDENAATPDWIPFIILSPLILSPLCVSPKHTSMSCGSCASSTVRWANSMGDSSAITNDVGMELEAVELLWPLVLCKFFWGHSFFQCPFCMQIRQKELAILRAKPPAPEKGFFPLDLPFPFFPKPLSNRFETGQKPRTFTRSLKRRRASW